MKIKTKYCNDDNCSLHISKFSNGSISLNIQDQYGHPLINVTKVLTDYDLAKNQVLVKNYSENEGILECLVNEGIIADTGITISTGYSKLHLCTLLIDPETYQQKEN